MASETADPHEQFIRLLARHEPEVRAFIRASLPDPLDVAEVMQEASLVAWRKFETLDDAETGFAKWLTVIARFEILKFRRDKARDRLVLAEDVVEKMMDEAIEERNASSSAWLEALSHCLQKLPSKQRDLTLRAYAEHGNTQRLAKELELAPNTLYQRLHRIRLRLADCVEQQLQASS